MYEFRFHAIRFRDNSYMANVALVFEAIKYNYIAYLELFRLQRFAKGLEIPRTPGKAYVEMAENVMDKAGTVKSFCRI